MEVHTLRNYGDLLGGVDCQAWAKEARVAHTERVEVTPECTCQHRQT